MVENENGGLFVSDDAGATWKLSQRRSHPAPARLLLQPHLRRPQGQGHGLRAQHRLLPVDRRRQDVPHHPHAPRRQPRPVDRPHQPAPHGQQQRRRRQRLHQRRPDAGPASSIATAQLYHVAVTNEIPYHVCGAQQDNSTICVSSTAGGGRGGGAGRRRSQHLQRRWRRERLHRARPAQSQHLLCRQPGRAAHPLRPPHRTTPKTSRSTRCSSPAKAPDRSPSAGSGPSPSSSRRSIPTSSTRLRSTSGRPSTTATPGPRISRDLTRGDPKTLGDSGGPITHDQNGPEIYGTIFTIAPVAQRRQHHLDRLRRRPGLHHAATATPRLRTGPRSPRPACPISAASASSKPRRTIPAAAYVAVKNYQNDDRKPYIFKTADYGKTWTKIVNGIPENDFVHAVREDPVRQGLLFAGTEHGIYVSFDDGAEWQSICAQPARHAGARHRDRRQRRGDRHARPLLLRARRHHSAAPVEAGAGHRRRAPVPPAHGRAQRRARRASTTTSASPPTRSPSTFSMPRARWSAPSPARRTTRPTVAAAAGVARRRRTARLNEARRRSGSGDSGGGGGRGRGGVVNPPDKAGLNRFTWDMRYPPAQDFRRHGPVERQHAGPDGRSGHVPGAADGQRQDRHREARCCEKDPRLDSVTIADLAEQFSLALKVRDDVTQANEIVILVRELKKQMDDRLKQNQRRRALKAALDRVPRQAERDRGRCLPGAQPQRPGPAQLPHQAEQQDRRAGAQHRARRRQTDRGVVRSVQTADRASWPNSRASSTRC